MSLASASEVKSLALEVKPLVLMLLALCALFFYVDWISIMNVGWYGYVDNRFE